MSKDRQRRQEAKNKAAAIGRPDRQEQLSGHCGGHRVLGRRVEVIETALRQDGPWTRRGLCAHPASGTLAART